MNTTRLPAKTTLPLASATRPPAITIRPPARTTLPPPTTIPRPDINSSLEGRDKGRTEVPAPAASPSLPKARRTRVLFSSLLRLSFCSRCNRRSLAEYSSAPREYSFRGTKSTTRRCSPNAVWMTNSAVAEDLSVPVASAADNTSRGTWNCTGRCDNVTPAAVCVVEGLSAELCTPFCRVPRLQRRREPRDLVLLLFPGF